MFDLLHELVEFLLHGLARRACLALRCATVANVVAATSALVPLALACGVQHDYTIAVSTCVGVGLEVPSTGGAVIHLHVSQAAR